MDVRTLGKVRFAFGVIALDSLSFDMRVAQPKQKSENCARTSELTATQPAPTPGTRRRSKNLPARHGAAPTS